MDELKLKKNTLGGEIYMPKTKEQLKIDIAQMELDSRKDKEKLNGKER